MIYCQASNCSPPAEQNISGNTRLHFDRGGRVSRTQRLSSAPSAPRVFRCFPGALTLHDWKSCQWNLLSIVVQPLCLLLGEAAGVCWRRPDHLGCTPKTEGRSTSSEQIYVRQANERSPRVMSYHQFVVVERTGHSLEENLQKNNNK